MAGRGPPSASLQPQHHFCVLHASGCSNDFLLIERDIFCFTIQRFRIQINILFFYDDKFWPREGKWHPKVIWLTCNTSRVGPTRSNSQPCWPHVSWGLNRSEGTSELWEELAQMPMVSILLSRMHPALVGRAPKWATCREDLGLGSMQAAQEGIASKDISEGQRWGNPPGGGTSSSTPGPLLGRRHGQTCDYMLIHGCNQ